MTIFNIYKLLPRHANAKPNSLCQRAYKKLALAPYPLLNFSIWSIFQHYKTYTATLKAGQFFMPTLMPCKWSLTRQFLLDDLAICKDALFITALYIIFCNWTVSVLLIKLPPL
jgi:hypothetical protein